MQNFSPLGNLINSFLQQQANRAGMNSVFDAGAPIMNPAPQQNAPKTPLPQQQNLSNNANTQLVMAQMENTERSVLVKELLNLPTTLQELISTLQTAKPAQQAQPQTPQQINVAQLMQLMQTNGKEALSKLIQITGLLNKQGNVDTKQLQELQFIVNACIPGVNTTNTQFMKNLILLYLPWLPIGENNNFDIEFSSSEEESKEGSADDVITILIQTENYGNVKVLLVLESVNKVNIVVDCAKFFPKELLLSRLKESSQEYLLETAVAVNEHEIMEKGELGGKTVHMSGASVLSPYVLLMAHAVIRWVIDIDKSQTLVTARKKVIKEN